MGNWCSTRSPTWRRCRPRCSSWSRTSRPGWPERTASRAAVPAHPHSRPYAPAVGGVSVRDRIAGQPGVAEVMLDRAEAMNAINTAMALRLAQACAELATDREVRAIVLYGTGARAFCVGADLKERNRMSDADMLRQRLVFRAAFGGLLALPQPVIGAVHGYALGAGSELPLSSHVIAPAQPPLLTL